MERRQSFAILLRRARMAAGLTQDALAERAHLSARTVSDLERGINLRPRVDSLLLLAEALALSPADRAAFERAARQISGPPATGEDGHVSAGEQPPSLPRTNLRRTLTSFVDRPGERAALCDLLATAPLVTLTGVGGCGKTRLAQQVAADLLPRYPDGVWLVELAPVATLSLVPQAVAAALGVVEEADHPLPATLAAFLERRRLLLVLDNCEHLVAACADLTLTLLQRCPDLHVLATSREALGCAGERTLKVPSLTLPDPAAPLTGEVLSASEAVQLFVARAQAAAPSFSPSVQQWPTIVQICRRLDGIPLALELAAARLSALLLDDLAARLDDRFRLLTGGSRTVLPRQQTLRATLDWSWGLLHGDEQVLLPRLAVFAGGWTLDAAETVCGAEGIEPEAVLEALAGLVHRSLVALDEAARRYRLLETVRQYALEHLVTSGEAAAVREHHLHWCQALVARSDLHYGMGEAVDRLNRMEPELDNLRMALGWAQDSGQLTAGLQLAQALGPFWGMHSHRVEGLRWLETFLHLPPAAGTSLDDRHPQDAAALVPLRARAFGWAAHLAQTMTEPRRAGEFAAQSLALYRQLDDRAGMAIVLDTQGSAVRDAGDYAQAVALGEESVRLWQVVSPPNVFNPRYNLALTVLQQGDPARAAALLQECVAQGVMDAAWGSAVLRLALGQVAWEEGDLGRARILGEQSLAWLRSSGDRRNSGVALGLLLGQVAREQGDLHRAVALCEESLALGRELADGGVIGWASLSLGLAAGEQGDGERATASLLEGLRCFWFRGMRWFVARCLAGLAGVAGRQGQAQRAAWIAGAAEALLAQTGAPLPRGEQAPFARAHADACAALGEAAYAAARAAGQAAPLEAVIAEAQAG